MGTEIGRLLHDDVKAAFPLCEMRSPSANFFEPCFLIQVKGTDIRHTVVPGGGFVELETCLRRRIQHSGLFPFHHEVVENAASEEHIVDFPTASITELHRGFEDTEATFESAETALDVFPQGKKPLVVSDELGECRLPWDGCLQTTPLVISTITNQIKPLPWDSISGLVEEVVLHISIASITVDAHDKTVILHYGLVIVGARYRGCCRNDFTIIICGHLQVRRVRQQLNNSATRTSKLTVGKPSFPTYKFLSW